MNSAVSKTIALAMLSAPMLAALAIGLAEIASATPADPQPSVPGNTAKSALASSFPSASMEAGLAEAGLHMTPLAPNVGGTSTAPSKAPHSVLTRLVHAVSGYDAGVAADETQTTIPSSSGDPTR